jgi:hypothetical protein
MCALKLQRGRVTAWLLRGGAAAPATRQRTPLVIAHRGNLAGPRSAAGGENSAAAIAAARAAHVPVELDVWHDAASGAWALGHDAPAAPLPLPALHSLLAEGDAWLHAKTGATLVALQRQAAAWGLPLRAFYHTDEDYVLTTAGDVVAFPGQPVPRGGVRMMPEWGLAADAAAAAVAAAAQSDDVVCTDWPSVAAQAAAAAPAAGDGAAGHG